MNGKARSALKFASADVSPRDRLGSLNRYLRKCGLLRTIVRGEDGNPAILNVPRILSQTLKELWPVLPHPEQKKFANAAPITGPQYHHHYNFHYPNEKSVAGEYVTQGLRLYSNNLRVRNVQLPASPDRGMYIDFKSWKRASAVVDIGPDESHADDALEKVSTLIANLSYTPKYTFQAVLDYSAKDLAEKHSFSWLRPWERESYEAFSPERTPSVVRFPSGEVVYAMETLEQVLRSCEKHLDKAKEGAVAAPSDCGTLPEQREKYLNKAEAESKAGVAAAIMVEDAVRSDRSDLAERRQRLLGSSYCSLATAYFSAGCRGRGCKVLREANRLVSCGEELTGPYNAFFKSALNPSRPEGLLATLVAREAWARGCWSHNLPGDMFQDLLAKHVEDAEIQGVKETIEILEEYNRNSNGNIFRMVSFDFWWG